MNKGTGLFQTLDQISAEVASARSREDASTVAAHTEHIRFYVAVHHKLMLGSRDSIDWDESWRIKTVNLVAWNDLRQDLRRGYRTLVEHLRTLNKWEADETGLTLAIIAHTAYHLGAIRQLVLAAESSS